MIDSIRFEPKQIKVYNFTVKDYHTYFVSNVEILAHNCWFKPKGWDNLTEKERYAYLTRTGEHSDLEELYRQVSNAEKVIQSKRKEVGILKQRNAYLKQNSTTVNNSSEMLRNEAEIRSILNEIESLWKPIKKHVTEDIKILENGNK